MKGLTVFETEAVLELISQITAMNTRIDEIYTELKRVRKPYMTTTDVVDFTGFGPKWVQDNKEKIGFTIVGGHLRFKRSDVDAFMEARYFKSKKC